MDKCIRRRLEEREFELLSDHAAKSAHSQGRKRPEEPCPLRTSFQRDRDKIIHSKAFRRLKHKTQVFLAPEGDHYRTRLTHTLEVYQIADTIARSLFLNQDLTEAIALGHDIGHTPFGHAGERALDQCMTGGFRHYEQSVRVLERIEKTGKGINLTAEVIDGINSHTNLNAKTLEGRIVRFADRIAYMNHDIEDAICAGVLSETDIPEDLRKTLGAGKTKRIDCLIRSLIDNSGSEIKMDNDIFAAFERLHQFLFETVYHNPVAKGEESKVEELVKQLFRYFTKNCDKLPLEYQKICETEGIERAACDYIAGMTDRFAIGIYSDIFVPKVWQKV